MNRQADETVRVMRESLQNLARPIDQCLRDTYRHVLAERIPDDMRSLIERLK